MVAITTASTDFPSRPALVLLPPVTRTGARVYRRRRLAVLLAAVALIALVGVTLSSLSGDATAVRIQPADGPALVREPSAYGAAGQALPARAVYVVQPGDTVWSIARSVDPGGDVRALVDRIVSLNGDAALQPGQRLRLTGN